MLIVFVLLARVQEAYGRIACVSNLKQLGLAVHNYESVYGRFPSATASRADPKLAPERRLSWYLDIYPAYVEDTPQPPFDRSKAWDAKENQFLEFPFQDKDGTPRTGCVGPVRLLLCPTNPNQPEPHSVGVAHYVGIAGLGRDAATLSLDNPAAGFFGYDRHLQRKDFKNGLSETLMLMETRRDNGPWIAGGHPTVRGLDRDEAFYIRKNGQFGHHRSGANALFADAFVKTLSDSMDRSVLEAMSTVAGGGAVRDSLP